MQVMAFTFLFSSLSTTISLSQLGIDEDRYPGLANGIKYTFVVASTISTILVGYVKLFKLQEMMDANIEMHKDWLEFATKISGELQMPKQLRTPALKLLQDMKDSYIGLFCKRPFVPGMIKRYANRYFLNYTHNAIEERSCICYARHNYIKLTNIFFVFQDIMKNEIKRLAAEIEVGNNVINENEQSMLDGPLASGTELGRPRLPESSELKKNIMIRYVYDGPFISIEVIDKPTQSQNKPDINNVINSENTNIDMNQFYRRNMSKERRSEGRRSEGRKTLFKAARQKFKNIGGNSNDSEDDSPIEEYRPRAPSFQAPERALYTQMQYRSTEQQPTRSSELANTKSSSFAIKQKKDLGDLVKQINEEIVAKRRKSVIPTKVSSVSNISAAATIATSAIATSANSNADANYENFIKLFPMSSENDDSSVESRISSFGESNSVKSQEVRSNGDDHSTETT
jgi:hypothetical protein